MEAVPPSCGGGNSLNSSPFVEALPAAVYMSCVHVVCNYVGGTAAPWAPSFGRVDGA